MATERTDPGPLAPTISPLESFAPSHPGPLGRHAMTLTPACGLWPARCLLFVIEAIVSEAISSAKALRLRCSSPSKPIPRRPSLGAPGRQHPRRPDLGPIVGVGIASANHCASVAFDPEAFSRFRRDFVFEAEYMVPAAGLEPALPYEKGILSPLRATNFATPANTVTHLVYLWIAY